MFETISAQCSCACVRVRRVDVADPSATWLGGATMAASLAFERQWVSRADYDELGGAGALLRKPPVGY